MTDEEDSSGTGVHLSPSSAHDSQDYPEDYTEEDERDDRDDWEQVDQADLVSSESASRPGTTNRRHITGEPRHPPDILLRRASRGIPQHVHLEHQARAHRQLHPASPESVDSNEDLSAYGPEPVALRQRRPNYHWVPAQGHGAPAAYAPSYSSQGGYSQYAAPSLPHVGQSMMGYASPPSQYAYYQHNQTAPAFFPPNPPGVSPMGPSMHPGSGYFPYSSGFPMPHPMASAPYSTYPTVYPPHPSLPSTQTPPAPSPAPNDNAEQLEELKKLYLEERAEREAREAAAKHAAEAAKVKAEQDKKVAEEIASASAAAAAAATTEAEKKAAEKAKAEAEAAAAAAAAAAPAPVAPEEKKKTIKFKDAIGRKFSFPFDLCKTWEVCSAYQDIDLYVSYHEPER